MDNCKEDAMTTASTEMDCKCCGGAGVQKRIDGIKVRCPECLGTGQWQVYITPVVTYQNWYYYCPYPKWDPPYPYPYVTAYGYMTNAKITEVK